MSIITIIGSGMMGSALTFPLTDNGNSVRLVGTHLDTEIIKCCLETGRHPKFDKPFHGDVKYFYFDEVKEALVGCDLVICGVSSFGVEWFAEKVIPILPDGTVVLSVTKGLFDDSDGNLSPYPFYWEKCAQQAGKKLSFNAIGGPCTSYELIFGDNTEVAFCGRDIETLNEIKAMFETDYYHIAVTTDVIGIESAVAFKNGYALAVALTIGINQKNFGENSGLHFNSQAAVFGQSVSEMRELLKMQGAGDYALIVGVGDLYVTVYGGRTRLAGILLGKGLTIDEVQEQLKGVTLESLVVAERVARAIKVKAERGLVDKNRFPLLLHVGELIANRTVAEIPWKQFSF